MFCFRVTLSLSFEARVISAHHGHRRYEHLSTNVLDNKTGNIPASTLTLDIVTFLISISFLPWPKTKKAHGHPNGFIWSCPSAYTMPPNIRARPVGITTINREYTCVFTSILVILSGVDVWGALLWCCRLLQRSLLHTCRTFTPRRAATPETTSPCARHFSCGHFSSSAR